MMQFHSQTYYFHCGNRLIEKSFDDHVTVGEALDMLSFQAELPTAALQLFMARKNGEPKLSYPPFERSRLLSKTYETHFCIIAPCYRNSLSRNLKPIEIPSPPKKNRLLQWLGCQ